MDIPSFLLNQDLAGSLITIAGQSILVSLIGYAITRLISLKSAPVRSFACIAVLLAIGFVATVSIGLRLSGISWSQATIPVSWDSGKADERISFTMDRDLPPILISPVFLTPPAIAEEKVVANSFPPTRSYSRLYVIPPPFYINFLGVVWLIGILFQLSKLGYGVVLVKNFRNTLEDKNDVPFDDMLCTIARTFWKNRLPALYSSPSIDSPITIGLLKPVVIIPQKLLPTLTENELKSILLHELAHIYHHDQVIGVLKRVVLAIFWWNPLVYIINREHEQAREEVSDNYVLGELSPGVYIQCLMTLAEKVCLISNCPTAAGMAGRRFDLKMRVVQLSSKKRNLAIRTRSFFKAMTISICIACIFGIAGLHAHVSIEEFSPAAKELHKAVIAIDPHEIFEEAKSDCPEDKIDLEGTGQKVSADFDVVVTKNDTTSNKTPFESYAPALPLLSGTTEREDKFQKYPALSAVQATKDTVLKKGAEDHILIRKKESIVSDISDENDSMEMGSAHTGTEQKRGKAYSSQKYYEKTFPDDNMTPRKKPSQTDSYMVLGNMYQRQGRIDDAISSYDTALKLNPDNVDTYTARGIAYCSKEQYSKAIQDFNKALKLDHLKALAYLARGSAYFRLDRLSKAFSDYNKAIEINPDLAAAYQNRGSVYYHRGQFDNALQEYNKAIEKNPNLAASYIDRGNIFERWGRIEDAISDYSRALELNPDDPETYINRGIAYYSQKQYQKAFGDFSKAIELNPGFVSAYIYRGYFYQTEEVYEKALTDYSKALMLDPDDAVASKLRNEIEQVCDSGVSKKDAPEDTLNLVCRRRAPTGTRFKNTICSTKAKWNDANLRGEELVRDIIQHSGL